jgi:hypothetical protein
MDLADAQMAKYLIDRGARDSAKVILLGEKIDTLNSIIVNQDAWLKSRDSTIRLYSWLDVAYRQLDANWSKNDSLCNKQVAAERKTTDFYIKKYKGARRKTVFVGIAGVALTVATGIIVHKN